MPHAAACDPRSALDLIGGTPLLTLSRLHPGPGRLLAKAEFVPPDARVATVLCDTGLKY